MNNFKEITIERRRLDDPFARIPKSVIDDPNVSCKAKFILCYVLSRPEGWNFSIQEIVNSCSDGETAIRIAIHELRESGYASLVKSRSKDGRFIRFYLMFSHNPDLFDEALRPDDGGAE